jgi:hypothetical protein
MAIPAEELQSSHDSALALRGVLSMLCALDLVQAAAGFLVASGGADSTCVYASSHLAWWGSGSIGVIVGCAIGYVRWLQATSRAARHFGANPPTSSVRRAALGFVVPIVSLWWPYTGLRDLDRAIDPSLIPAPLRAAKGGHARGYRDDAGAPAFEASSIPRPPLELWWALWLFRAALSVRLVPSVAIISVVLLPVVDLCGALVAIEVIRRIDARLAERAFRVGVPVAAPAGEAAPAPVSSPSP